MLQDEVLKNTEVVLRGVSCFYTHLCRRLFYSKSLTFYQLSIASEPISLEHLRVKGTTVMVKIQKARLENSKHKFVSSVAEVGDE